VSGTVRDVVNCATEKLSSAGIASPRLEAELLLARATGWPRPVVLIHTERPVPDEALAKFHELIARRCRRQPLQQIVGETEFFGLRVLVDENVMSPRPETEVLVEQVVKRWRPGFRSILDIGTGSGCIAVALAMNVPECRVDAVDVSEKALEVAGRNVGLHGLGDRVRLIECDLFPGGGKAYDVIVSNPPYIPSGEIDGLMPEVSKYEPRLALDGGGDGYKYYRKIAEAAPARLRAPGLLALEVGAGQAAAVRAMMSEAFGRLAVAKAKDLCGIERVVIGETRKNP
jgi:release factor glutamine methyltransferase